jgi:hypothetical protein
MNLKYLVISELSKIASILQSNYKILLTDDSDRDWGVKKVYLETSDIIDWEDTSTVSGREGIKTKKELISDDYTEIKNYQKPLKEKYKSFSVDGVINTGDKKGNKVKLEILWGGSKNSFTFFYNDEKTEKKVKKENVLDMVKFIKNYVEPKEDYFDLSSVHKIVFRENKKNVVNEINQIIKENLPFSYFTANSSRNTLIFDMEDLYDKEKQKEIFQKFENNLSLIKDAIYKYSDKYSDKFDIEIKLTDKSIVLKLK